MCPTYSSHLYVPAGADDTVVRGSAKFRSKGRLPALSYYYPQKKVSTKQLENCMYIVHVDNLYSSFKLKDW